MKFQVESVIFDEGKVDISNGNYDIENVYSMLVGKNACGKTRLLSKLANNYIFEKDPLGFNKEVFVSYNSQIKPSQVIAVSNSRFDRFPNPDVIGRSSRRDQEVPYHYLGLAGFRSSPSGVMAKACVPLIDGLTSNINNAEAIARILDYIGFLPILHIELRRSFPFSGRGYWDIQSIYEQFKRKEALQRGKVEDAFDFERDLLPGLVYFSEQRNQSLSLHIDFMRSWWNQSNDGILKYAPNLIKSGILSVSRFNLFSKSTKDRLPFSHASSGQQCMLLMFFGIAGLIKDGSLICIDEPEISLHPRWQAEFIGILQDAFSIYRGCHFVIATHSPQVVSGLTSRNGFVIDLESRKLLLSESYAKKSADFQLTQVFHEPGFKNEYLIRTLLVILSRLTKQEQLTSDDFDKLLKVESIQERLEAADPVLHLLQQIKVLAGLK